MNIKDTESRIREIVECYLGQEGLELVDISLRYQSRNLTLKILLDRPESGISIDECAFLNTEINAILESHKLLDDDYVLEVSSPGLDRLLKSGRDFSRCRNRRARFFLTQPIAGKMEIEGVIRGVTDTAVKVDTDGAAIEIPFTSLRMAKQVIKI